MASNAARQALKLYVGNLPWTIGTQELKHYFSKFGHINSASVVFDKNTGLSKNYGFVVYSNKEGFESATNSTNHFLEGNNLKVEAAN
ncbi:SRA stem-loop-interacting RNA-binding protein, mitochondrial-like [Atheta coriaria]|uniref:SRA stem-loop-interacting RNA-binding protein, mitochondrial-like n=1 Tax=Dalotia coriaria TaxID=877792 RepID=UPI0031F3EA8A